MSSNAGNRPHIIKGNFVWELPRLARNEPGPEGCGGRGERLAVVRCVHRRIGHDV